MEKETTPSQSEWMIMEVFWACDTSLTAKEVIKKIREKTVMSPRMVRVLLNRLWQKGVLGYTVDEHDARVYHYFVVKTKEECQKEKAEGLWTVILKETGKMQWLHYCRVQN